MVQVLQSASPASCKTSSTFIDSIRPDNQLRKNKESKIEIQLPTNCIVLPWPSTQNPGLKEVDLESSPTRGRDKIKMQKQGRNTQKKASRIVQPTLTYGSQHLPR